jgi:N6-L-threonylcarbamoyladenine synthase
MTVFALETSCDETSAALVRHGEVLANVVSSQIALHAAYGGVVPELATREHLRNWRPVAQSAMDQAGVTLEAIDAFAATQGPGLPHALMVGLKAAQALAFTRGKPFIGIHHHEAHLYSPWIEGTPARARFDLLEPNVSLIVSGGHTMLVHVTGQLEHHALGGTLDDAAGECFDKVAKLIGLGYPGGPELDRLAGRGCPTAYDFPRPLLKAENDDFSFAGLKTAVRYFLQKNPGVLADDAKICDLCASVQAAIVETLVGKTLRAARRLGVRCVTASGGVTCNRGLRLALREGTERMGLRLRLADAAFCTDNAGMIAVLAERKLALGGTAAESDLDVEMIPGWALPDSKGRSNAPA